MDYKSYSDKKKEYDNTAFLYIAKRLFEDLDESDAAEEGIIDGVGNVLQEVNHTNDWAFTALDRLLLMLRQQLGEENVRNMLQHYSFTKDIDPLFIMSHGPKYNYGRLRRVLGSIVTKVEDKSYLPEYLYHEENEEYIEDDGLNFTEKVRRAFTVASYLLYCIRNNKTPNNTIYDKNVIPSIELTFGMRPYGNFDEIVEFCDGHKLTYAKEITGEGIRLVVELSKLFDDAELLIKDSSRIENQTNNWKKLAKEKL